ncbi:hypothetical protein [Streptomyces sp. V3I7]|uniref:hypothetical protein n=1 Tax=Streptomyces sp. V3I7 TaxID=3042278 RepID=UPI002788BF59|nr:hypothetical protein [Streptomyces sp. V3I7]MDQ0992005.1 hypothetical protein [Streptomyces sp. V3I7]
MTEQTTPTPDRPAKTAKPAPASEPSRQSFSATPTEQARAYQTGRDQTINEHHHYAPRRSLRSGIAWSLAGATILALGAVAGADLWERHTAADAAPASDAKTQGSLSPSPTPSTTAKPTSKASPSPAPTAPRGEQPAPAATTPSTSPSGPLRNPATSCTSWHDAGFSRVQVKPCMRIGDDGALYMIAEWRTTSGSAMVDVYVWLEDATGTTVVYPGASVQNGMAALNVTASPTPGTGQQWREFKVGKPLDHGEKYQVSVSVKEHGAPGPGIAGPGTKGFQLPVVYS